MFRKLLVLNLILCPFILSKRKHHRNKGLSQELGGDFVTSLRNDANLDLSMDEEYEDLRAELLAYHTALSSLTNDKVNHIDGLPPEVARAVAEEPGNNGPFESRRSLKTTPCWKLGGVCVQFKLCVGHRFLSEVNACKNNLEVCCFAWNKYQIRDFVEHGVSNLALPWSIKYEFGGKGPIRADEKNDSKTPGAQKEAGDEDSGTLNVDLSSSEARPQKLILKLNNSKEIHNFRKSKPALLVVVKPDKK